VGALCAPALHSNNAAMSWNFPTEASILRH
jgi:hypothetical protein